MVPQITLGERLPIFYQLGDEARKHRNPFFERIGKFDDPYDEFIDICKSNLTWAVYNIFRNPKDGRPLELAPFQSVILQELWNRTFPIMVCSRGASKSFMLAVYAILRAIFTPGSKIVIVASSFRQSRIVFNYIEEFHDASPIIRAATARVHKPADAREMKIGDSVIMALPLGNGEKIRGVRASHILVDEFSSIPPDIFQVVVRGFAAVSANPILAAKQIAMENEMIKAGKLNAKDRKKITGNQIVYSGTASYQFNHFYKLYRVHEEIIKNKFVGNAEEINKRFEMKEDEALIEGDIDFRDYSIIQIPYNAIPKGFMDEKQIAQAKATMTSNLFYMEYCCTFPTDSDGFFKRSLINEATPGFFDTAGAFPIEPQGEYGAIYAMGIDPARKTDNFSISILKIMPDKSYRNVLCYSMNNKSWPVAVSKVRELMAKFNIVRIAMDAGGGGTTVMDLLQNPSNGEPPIWCIDDEDNARKQGLHILEMVNFTPTWIAEANYGLASDIEHKRIKFPWRVRAQAREVGPEQEEIWDEIDDQKNEMCKIVVTATKTGIQHFDLPDIASKDTEMATIERKDRYSALLLSSYAARTYLDKDKPMIIPVMGRWI